MKPLTLLPTLLSLTVANPLVYPRAAPTTCNGQASFCNRQYSNISFIGTHDSPFVGPLTQVTANQDVDVTAQLNAGIRFLQGQTHKNAAGDLHFCHTHCWLEDAGPVSAYLAKVTAWLDANPNDVVTILLANGDYDDVSVFNGPFQQANLARYAYIPPHEPLEMDQWPTLGELIQNNTRLVVFMDYDANTNKVPYILPEFTHYIFETPYDTTDPNFNECSLNRPPNGKPEGRMYLINHFLDKSFLGALIPDTADDFRTNAAHGAGSIGAQANLCEGIYGRPPNFVLVDRFDRGQVFQAQNDLNFGKFGS